MNCQLEVCLASSVTFITVCTVQQMPRMEKLNDFKEKEKLINELNENELLIQMLFKC